MGVFVEVGGLRVRAVIKSAALVGPPDRDKPSNRCLRSRIGSPYPLSSSRNRRSHHARIHALSNHYAVAAGEAAELRFDLRPGVRRERLEAHAQPIARGALDRPVGSPYNSDSRRRGVETSGRPLKDREGMEKALITGVSGHDGAYVSAFLLGKGYHRTRRQAPGVACPA